MESHPINEKLLLNLFLCEGLWLWKKVLWGGCKAARVAAMPAWMCKKPGTVTQHLQTQPNVLYTPLPTGSLGSLYIPCRGPAKIIKHNNFHKAAGWNLLQVVKAMENPCDSDMHETTHCSEGSHSGEYSLPCWLSHLAFWGLQEPQQDTALSIPTFQAEPQLSQSPHYPLSWNWAGTATSNLCLKQQTSTGSDFCKGNQRNSLVWNCCTFSFQYWVKEKRQVSYVGLACGYFSKTVIGAQFIFLF